MNRFFCSIFDGNPREWELNMDQTHHVGPGPEAALSVLCAHNQGGEDFIGPQRYFGNEQMFVLVCSWTMGHEVWPFIIMLHSEEKTEDELRAVLAEHGVNIDLKEDLGE